MKGMNMMMGSSKTEAEYQAMEDLRVLTEAERIERDPKRFKAAKALAKKKLEDLQKIVDEDESKS